jgi:hypothetical protein
MVGNVNQNYNLGKWMKEKLAWSWKMYYVYKNKDIVDPMFVHFSYAKEVWNESLKLSNSNIGWREDSLLTYFKS